MAGTDLKPIPTLPQKAIERFWRTVHKASGQGPQGECWEWTGSVDIGGYGRFGIAYNELKAHRVAYFLQNGDDPGPLRICHHCDNPPCCRGEHLFKGTTQDNRNDCVRKGRQAKGDSQGLRLHPTARPFGDKNGSRTRPEVRPRGSTVRTSKLTEEIARRIRVQCAGRRGAQIKAAKEYNVSRSAIGRICRGETWKHA